MYEVCKNVVGLFIPTVFGSVGDTGIFLHGWGSMEGSGQGIRQYPSSPELFDSNPATLYAQKVSCVFTSPRRGRRMFVTSFLWMTKNWNPRKSIRKGLTPEGTRPQSCGALWGFTGPAATPRGQLFLTVTAETQVRVPHPAAGLTMPGLTRHISLARVSRVTEPDSQGTGEWFGPPGEVGKGRVG